MQYNNKILLSTEEDGGYMITVPALPGCISQGDTNEEAIAMAKEAIELYMVELQSGSESVPGYSNTIDYTLNLETT